MNAGPGGKYRLNRPGNKGQTRQGALARTASAVPGRPRFKFPEQDGGVAVGPYPGHVLVAGGWAGMLPMAIGRGGI